MSKLLSLLFLCSVLMACSTKNKAQNLDAAEALKKGGLSPVVKSDKEWKAELDEMEYYVIREKGTERSFSGDLWDHKEDGVYTCRACALPLFDSKTKFKSGTGWPSYYAPVKEEYIRESTDHILGSEKSII